MKKTVFIIMLFAIAMQSNKAVTQDTLRNYNPEHVHLNYSQGNAIYYLSRYDLPAPGYVEQIRLFLDGTGEGTVSLYGHEGGSPFGELKKDLIEPMPFTKTEDGVDYIDFILNEPLWLENSQFFVVIDISDSDLSLLNDIVGHPPVCSSTSGGSFHPTVIAVPGEHQFYDHIWQTHNRGLIIDVIMNFPIKESPEYFKDVTESLGIPLDISSRTIAWGDYNNNGYLDLLVSGRLFKNHEGENFVEVTNEKGILGSARANAFVDINNNGLLDIIIFHSENHLYLNNGDNTFTHKVLSIPEFPNITSFNFADLNNNNLPDLFIGQLWSSYPVPSTNYLFFNNGENDFTDETSRIYHDYDGEYNFPNGVLCDSDNSNTWLVGGNRNRRSRGSQFIDFNNNGHLDLYVSNYFLERDELHMNDGEGNFDNVIELTILDMNTGGGSSHSTGIDWKDFNNNGNMDLLVPRLAHPWGIQLFNHKGTTLYKKVEGSDYDFEIVHDSGIQFEETHAGGTWGDINNDGLVDLIITTFYGCRYINLYTQNADNKFENKTFEYGLENIVTGRDAVFVDFNNDGRLDLSVGNDNRLRIYENTKPMDNKNWIQFDLQAINSNHFGIGARVKVEANGNIYTKDISAGRGVNMQKPYRLHYGLNEANNVDKVTVRWPNGNIDTYGKFASNDIYLLVEGEGNFVKEEIRPDKLSVSPNPSNDVIMVDAKVKIKNLHIYNISGQKVFSYNNLEDVELPVSIDVSSFKKGTYFIKANTESKKTIVKKIIKL